MAFRRRSSESVTQMAQTSLPASCRFVPAPAETETSVQRSRDPNFDQLNHQKLTGYFVKTASRLGHTVSARPAPARREFESERELSGEREGARSHAAVQNRIS